MSFASDKKVLIWSTNANLLRRSNLKPADIMCRSLAGHKRSVYTAAELPHGRLATGSADGQVRVWDAASGEQLKELSAHADGVLALQMLENGTFATASADSTIRSWEV